MKASALCVVRWILGGCFVYLGWVKTRDPVAFLKVIREFNLLQAPPFDERGGRLVAMV